MASSFAGKLRLFSAPAQSILRHGRSMATAAHPQQSAITPLHNSCRGGDKEAVKAILKGPQAAKFLNVPEHEGLTPLHLSAAQGHVEIVQLLVHAGASPLSRTQAGVTPKMLAEQRLHISNQYQKVVEVLSEAEQKQSLHF